MTISDEPTEKGLTGIEETIRGFVGRRNLKFTATQSTNRAVLTFDIGSGTNNPQQNSAPIWRHCILYGGLATNFKESIRPSARLRVSGWLVSNYVKDDRGHYILQNNEPLTRETLIVECVEILDYSNDRQMSFSSAGRFK